MNHKKGDKVRGAIKSITDFGVFIGLPGGIDGLVHLSDLSWTATGEEAKQEFKKGDEVEAVVLSIDVEKERISLGIKQMDGDPFTSFIAMNDKNSMVSGVVKSVDSKGAVIELGVEIEGYLRVSEFSRDRIEDLSQHLKVGETIETMIINVDRKTRSISLSVKAKDQADQTQAMQKLAATDTSASSGTTNLGALLKAKLNQQ
jgi:small subunit ribosomal protein S1